MSSFLKNSLTKSNTIAILLVCHFAFSNFCTGQNVLAFAARPKLKTSLHFDSTLTYRDSIIYFFNTDVTVKADGQSIRPLLFRIKLPPGLESAYTSGINGFGFRYPGKQAVYIYLDRYSSNTLDTAYQITNELDIEGLLVDRLDGVNTPERLDIDNNPFNNQRDTWIIKKGKAIVLLYNIRKEASQYFLDYTAHFTFL